LRREEVLQEVKADSNIPRIIKGRKTNCIGHISRRNCFLKYFIQGKMVGRREVVGRGGRRHK
jgi:hypothetical protein